MVTSTPSSTTFTITMDTNEAGTPVTNAGSASVLCYYTVGSSTQESGFGWSSGLFGGVVNGEATTTLATALTDTITTNIVLTSSNAFPASGTIRIGTEDISYTANNTGTNTLSGGARGANSTTKTTHSSSAVVTNITDYNGWGEASSTTQFTLRPWFMGS